MEQQKVKKLLLGTIGRSKSLGQIKGQIMKYVRECKNQGFITGKEPRKFKHSKSSSSIISEYESNTKENLKYDDIDDEWDTDFDDDYEEEYYMSNSCDTKPKDASEEKTYEDHKDIEASLQITDENHNKQTIKSPVLDENENDTKRIPDPPKSKPLAKNYPKFTPMKLHQSSKNHIKRPKSIPPPPPVSMNNRKIINDEGTRSSNSIRHRKINNSDLHSTQSSQLTSTLQNKRKNSIEESSLQQISQNRRKDLTTLKPSSPEHVQIDRIFSNKELSECHEHCERKNSDQVLVSSGEQDCHQNILLKDSSKTVEPDEEDYEIPNSSNDISITISSSSKCSSNLASSPEIDEQDMYESLDERDDEDCRLGIPEVPPEVVPCTRSPSCRIKPTNSPSLPPRLTRGSPVSGSPPPLPRKLIQPPQPPEVKHQEVITVIQEKNNLINRPLPLPPDESSKEPPTLNESFENLKQCEWYFEIGREEAEKILKYNGASGMYLVRESKRGGALNPYTLSILYKNRVYHLNIRRRIDNCYALGSAKASELAFPSLPELIKSHQSDPILLSSRGLIVGQTCLLQTPLRRN